MKLTVMELNRLPIGSRITTLIGNVFIKSARDTFVKSELADICFWYSSEVANFDIKEVDEPYYAPYNFKYTFAKLRENPIGTRITFKGGKIMIKTEENGYKFCGCDGDFLEEDIVKVEEPIEYETVYEKGE